MTGVGKAGSALARAKPRDFDLLLALLAAMVDPDMPARLTEMRAAVAALVEAREANDVSAAELRNEGAFHQRAEDDARLQREALAAESARTRDELGRRELAVAERERAADDRETVLNELQADLDRRAGLLRDAGVELPE